MMIVSKLVETKTISEYLIGYLDEIIELLVLLNVKNSLNQF